MLEAFYEVSEDKDDKLCRENLAPQYRLIFIAFHDTLLQKSIPSIMFCGKSDKEADRLLARPKYNIPAETLVFRGRKFRKYLEFRDRQFVGE